MRDAKKRRIGKPSFWSRIKNRGREFLNLGGLLLTRPKEFPRALLGFLRRSFRTIWDARGGGLYACGFLLTFIALEVRMFLSDIYTADSVSGFFASQASEIVFRYLGESIQNTVSAFVWPAYVARFEPPYGALLLVILFFVFPRFLKRPAERWLFGDEASSASQSSKKTGAEKDSV